MAGRPPTPSGTSGGSFVEADRDPLRAPRREAAPDDLAAEVRRASRHVGDPDRLLARVAVGAEQTLRVRVTGLAQQVGRACSSTMRPAYMTRMRSERSSTVPMSWLMKSTAKPCSRCRRRTFSRIECWTTTSRPVVGSSRRTNFGLEREGEGEVDALLHATGELVREGRHELRVDHDHLEELVGCAASTASPRSVAVLLDDVTELALDPDDGVQGVHAALEDRRDVAPAQRAQLVLAAARVMSVPSKMIEPPLIRPGRSSSRSRAVPSVVLPRAGLADEADELARLDAEATRPGPRRAAVRLGLVADARSRTSSSVTSVLPEVRVAQQVDTEVDEGSAPVMRIARTRPGTKTQSHRPWAIAPWALAW